MFVFTLLIYWHPLRVLAGARSGSAAINRLQVHRSARYSVTRCEMRRIAPFKMLHVFIYIADLLAPIASAQTRLPGDAANNQPQI